MALLTLFAFLAGIITILSPCILPILPIVLSGSVTGGKKRPLGIIAGFILSFTFFTLALSGIVKATGVSPDALRFASVVVVFTFGLSMLFDTMQVFIDKLFSKLSSLTAPNTLKHNTTSPDFIAGFLIGISLGLVWTPCVGPILASVISLALSGSVSGSAVLITLSYSLGTAIPLLAITYGGRQLLQKIPWLVTHTTQIRKLFGVLMIVTAFAIQFNLDRKFQTYILTKFPNYGLGLTKFEDNEAVKNKLNKLQTKPIAKTERGKPMYDFLESNLGKTPELIVGGEWINSNPLTLRGLRESVVLVDFWTYTCINCIRTLPYLKSWHTKYKDKGLVIVGVHTPEFEFEKNPDNVKKAVKDFDIEYPVMQDNDYATWNAYANRYWPAKYLIDKTGKIRYTHFGEGAYDETETMIQKLLREGGVEVAEDISNPKYQISARTPELYLGYRRIEALVSPEKIQKNQASAYTLPNAIPSNTFAYQDTWTIGDERAMPHQGSVLILNFDAREVFLVMRPKEKGLTGQIQVSIDDKVVTADVAGEDVLNGNAKIDVDRLYKLIKLVSPGRHLLKLEFFDSNLELYAFTFG